MKQGIRLHIPEPCHENWDDMTASQQGRFCMSCQKEVVDFSTMTDKEIIDYISGAGSKTCGRVGDDQLGRLIRPESDRRRFSFKYFWSLLISSSLISYKASAQKGEVKAICTKADTIPALKTIPLKTEPLRMRMGAIAYQSPLTNVNILVKGVVTNSRNEPVPYATVMVKGSTTGIQADSTGSFLLKTTGSDMAIELQASSVGYEQKVFSIDPKTIKNIAIEKKSIKIDIGQVILTEQVLDEVVVKAYPSTRCYTTMGATFGMMVTSVRVSKWEKVKTKLNDLVTKTDIKVYPNPVPANSNFNVAFNLKDMGDYRAELIDASGRVALVRELIISAKNQLIAFNSGDLKGGGVYFMRVTGKQNRMVYNAKVVVQ